MSVYNDMANDAGYRYGSDENAQMAEMIENDQQRRAAEDREEEEYWQEQEEYWQEQEEIEK